MKKVNNTAHKTNSSTNPGWFFLAEFPFCEWAPDHDDQGELVTRLLFETVRELGMPPECVGNIESALASSTQEAWVLAGQGKYGLPGSIRIYCQGSAIKTNGGWGYFLVERSATSAVSAAGHPHGIDLYLYREGG